MYYGDILQSCGDSPARRFLFNSIYKKSTSLILGFVHICCEISEGFERFT